MTLHLAQVNIARMRAPLEDPVIWKSVEDLRLYAYRTGHAEMLRRRDEWFERLDGPAVALWWIRAGRRPSVDEGKKRLASLRDHGPKAFAFKFRDLFPPDADRVASVDESAFEPCPAR